MLNVLDVGFLINANWVDRTFGKVNLYATTAPVITLAMIPKSQQHLLPEKWLMFLISLHAVLNKSVFVWEENMF